MISAVESSKQIVFGHGNGGPEAMRNHYDKDTVIKRDLLTRPRIALDQFTNAVTVYPAKGLKGSKNSNFYEYLTMGTVPYLAGSAMMIALFNGANKFFPLFDKKQAAKIGGKMGLGVVMYGVMKELSKNFVTKPVQWATGIDPHLPYARVNFELPESIHDTDITSIEYHNVFESVGFSRFDLLPKEYFAKIAAKNGRGTNLADPEQEVKPMIREVITKTITAKNLSSYIWAAAGVALAVQKPWNNFFENAQFKPWRGKDFTNTMKDLPKTFWESSKTLWHTGHAGKILLGVAALSSVLGAANAIASAKNKNKSPNVINSNEKFVVN